MTITVDDRELITYLQCCCEQAYGPSEPVMIPAGPIHDAADRLQSLLSDRDKLEQLLERVWACRADVGQGRFINLEKLWPVIDDIGVALTQMEVP